ncbi:MAG: F0F1 ATP synthase subunit beta, partial [Anaerolineaceae bacterium]|nr:F0F1 ATP synthase subunit beta [Anaerolineaceae bacterium]
MDFHQGKILQIQGSVLDVAFKEGNTPKIYEALRVIRDDGTAIILEVEKLLENNIARCVAMDTTDGLQRNMSVERTG